MYILHVNEKRAYELEEGKVKNMIAVICHIVAYFLTFWDSTKATNKKWPQMWGSVRE